MFIFFMMMYGFLANKDLAVCSTLQIAKFTSGHDLDNCVLQLLTSSLLYILPMATIFSHKKREREQK
jgi:hypothetical protein